MPDGKIQTDRHEQMARVRAHRRPMTPSEGAAMAHRGNLQHALARLRPVHWPGDPLSVTEVAFVLNVSRSAVCAAIKEGRLRAERVDRVYTIQRSDVEALLVAQIRKAEASGIAVPEAALYVAGLADRRRKSPVSCTLSLEL